MSSSRFCEFAMIFFCLFLNRSSFKGVAVFPPFAGSPSLQTASGSWGNSMSFTPQPRLSVLRLLLPLFCLGRGEGYALPSCLPSPPSSSALLRGLLQPLRYSRLLKPHGPCSVDCVMFLSALHGIICVCTEGDSLFCVCSEGDS